MFLKILLGIWMSAVIVAAFLFAPPAKGFAQPEAARIIFFHVPIAMVSAIAFLVAAVYAIRYLQSHNPSDDIRSSISVELGMLYAVLATITGSLFAHMQWGSWWNWDPKETSITILLLVYAAYLALRSAVEAPDKRASLSAAYAILSLPAMGFLMFIMPRIMTSLHPADTLGSKEGLSNQYRLVLYPAMIGFLGIYVWLFNMKTALAEIKLKMRRK